jgi:yecA family protein
MTSEAAISHAELGAALADLRVGVGASDLHGSLTGYLCGGGEASAGTWLKRLALEPEEEPGTRHAVLDRLFRQCREQLDDPDLGFEPLLPDADEPLAQRADALVDWCRGFLGGIGLAGKDAQARLSSDGEEILRDFGTIASSRFEVEDAEEDESALTEVVEFIRVAVLLLHTELEAGPRRGTVH